MVKPTRERVKEWREKKAQKGGRSLSVWLEPETARMLHELLGHYGETVSPLIARAISTLYDTTCSAPPPAEPAVKQDPQPFVPEPQVMDEPPSVAPPAAASESPPPVQEGPSPMLEREAAAEQGREAHRLAQSPSPQQTARDQQPAAGEEDPLLKEIQAQLGRGVPFRTLHHSLLLDWLKAMQAQGISFQVMAERLNAAAIPTLAGRGRWEEGMIPTILLLSAAATDS